MSKCKFKIGDIVAGPRGPGKIVARKGYKWVIRYFSDGSGEETTKVRHYSELMKALS